MPFVVDKRQLRMNGKSVQRTNILGGAIQKRNIGDVSVDIDDQQSNLNNLKSTLKQIRLGPAKSNSGTTSKKKYIYF